MSLNIGSAADIWICSPYSQCYVIHTPFLVTVGFQWRLPQKQEAL